MSAVLDLFRVLWEPTAVYQRVSERPRWFTPFVAVVVMQAVLLILMLPYFRPVTEAAIQQALQARGATGSGMSVDTALKIAFVTQILFFIIIFFLSAGILWLVTSVMGGEAKFGTLLSVYSYAAIWIILQTAAAFLVFILKGKENLLTQEDLQPALGLDLLLPSVKGFLGFLLKGVTPFSVLMYWTIGTGVSVTHKLEPGKGRTIAFVTFLVVLVALSAFATMCASRAAAH